MLREWFERQCSHEPVRWFWPIIRIYGGEVGRRSTCYMTRVVLTPLSAMRKAALFLSGGRYDRLYFHVFHREDMDRDPHDHPFDFATLPLNQGYTEEVFDWETECFKTQRAPWWRWSRRSANHIHRVISCDRGWPLLTLVLAGQTKRKWGFWCHTDTQGPKDATRVWVPWQRYCFEGENANIDGADVNCPGVKQSPTTGTTMMVVFLYATCLHLKTTIPPLEKSCKGC